MHLKKMQEKAKESREKYLNLISQFCKGNNVFALKLSMTPKKYQRLFYSVFSSKPTPQKAIKAKCLDCTCFQKEEITNCTIKIKTISK